MATTCSDIVTRAKAFNTMNAPLTNDTSEILSRIRVDQQALFTSIAGVTRDRFQTTATLTSTNGSSGRSFNLATLTSAPVERILKVTLQDGRDLNQVDVLDTDAELSPRYYVQGLSLVEVSNDWGTSGSKTATLIYCYGPTDIDPTGSLTQAVTVPDQWTDLLVLPLAKYLAQKDPGRDPNEIARLQGMQNDLSQQFLSYLTTYGGIEVRRLVIPEPRTESSKT